MRKSIGALASLVATALALTGCEGSHDRDETKASVMCEQFVKDRLKAPSTADFGWSDYDITGSGDDYTVSGYVDAQNGFGAMIRNDFTCEIHDNGDDTWHLTSLTGLD